MKKVLALILCALMIVTAALPVFADGEPATEGKLAITEVAHNPGTDGANFEYIEVINTVEGTTVNLADYYIYRYLFSHSGKYAYSGFGQMMGTTGNSCAATTPVEITTETAIAYNTPTVIWLKTADKTVNDFVTYWQTKNANLTAANVVTIDLTDYVVSKWDSSKGVGFLPDMRCGFIVSFINDSFAATDVFKKWDSTNKVEVDNTFDGTKKVYVNEYYTRTSARHKAADTMTMVYAMADLPGKVANRYGYFDAKAFNDAVVEAEFNNPTTATLPTMFRYASLMMPKPASDGTVQLVRLEDTTFAWRNTEVSKSVYFLDVTAWEEPTPATLVAGQAVDGKYSSNIEATPVTTKGLAITEIMPAAIVTAISGTDMEFIEVTNKNDAAVTLTNYHLVLHGGTNDGGNDGTFVRRAFHDVQVAKQKSYAKVESVWNISVDSEGTVSAATADSALLTVNNTAVICFINEPDETKVANFAKHWADIGNDMNGVTVAVATYNVGESIANRGMGFLPDVKCGYGLALVDSSKRNSDSTLDDALTNSETLTAAGTAAYGKAIEAAADSVLWIIAEGGVEKNVSCNYYGYVDMNKYNADAQYYAQQIKAINGSTALNETNGIYQLQPNAVVMKGQPLYLYMHHNSRKVAGDSSSEWWGYGATNKNAATKSSGNNNVCVATILNSVPTPGKLIHGQFGYDAHNEATKTTIDVVGYQSKDSYQIYKEDGETKDYVATDIRIVGNFNLGEGKTLADYNFIGVEVASASAATNAHLIWTATGSVGTKSNAACTEKIEITDTNVYLSLTDQNGDEYINEDGYMFAINLSGIPSTNANLTFRCFVQDTQGNRTYTGMYQISDMSASTLA